MPPNVDDATPVVEFSDNSDSLYLQGTKVTYTCAAGMRIVTIDMITCMADSTWNETPGNCYLGKALLVCVVLNIRFLKLCLDYYMISFWF